jgi:signal transduction histidine kinase
MGPERREDEGSAPEALLSDEMAELRLRTAMELHDGILQTLTGANLQIAVARRLLRRDPAAAEAMLDTLADTLSAEQREIRLYVDELKGEIWSSGEAVLGLAERIAALLHGVRGIWGTVSTLEVDLAVDVPADVGRRVLRLIQEATVNAARHGSAKTVAIRVKTEGDEIAIRLADDGHGFPFFGDYDTEALRKKQLGPVSLKHRVEEGGGRIFVSSTPHGSTVSIWLPLDGESSR